MASITTSMPDTHKRFYLGAENVVQKKKEELQRRKRCLTCWHPKHLYCICKHTPTLNYKLKNIKFIIYMHYLEYANAGDDAKLLMCCSPERTNMYLHGVEKDDINMKIEIETFKKKSLSHKHGVVLLFPGPNSITIDTFLEQREKKVMMKRQNNNQSSGTVLNMPQEREIKPPLLVIVMDATWRRARRMANHFRKYIDADVPHIQLRPTTASIYARTQSQDGRICTIEALALLLKEYGEDENVCNALIDYVQLNNRALKCEFKNTNQILWQYDNNLSQGSGGHPAWYFGRVLVQERAANIQTIIEQDGNGNNKMKTIQSSPIQAENIIDAARLGLIEDVKRLLLKNINNKNNNNKDNNNTIVNTMNKYKWTALHKACFKGHLNIVEILVQHNANINLKTSDGNTALMLASWKGKSKVVKYLLEKNADYTLKNDKGQTAKMVAIKKRHNLCIQLIDQHMAANQAKTNTTNTIFNTKIIPTKRKQEEI